MDKLSAPTAHELRRVLWEHGRDIAREAWLARLENAPRAEFDKAPEGYYVGRVEDDGLGPVSRVLKMALLAALHAEVAQHLLVLADPSTSEDDAADAGNDATWFRGYIKWVEEWPSVTS